MSFPLVVLIWFHWFRIVSVGCETSFEFQYLHPPLCHIKWTSLVGSKMVPLVPHCFSGCEMFTVVRIRIQWFQNGSTGSDSKFDLGVPTLFQGPKMVPLSSKWFQWFRNGASGSSVQKGSTGSEMVWGFRSGFSGYTMVPGVSKWLQWCQNGSRVPKSFQWFWTAPKISAKSLNLTVFRLFWVCVGMQSACYAIYCFANYYIVLSGRAWLIYGAVIQLCRSRWPYVEGDPETRHVHFPNCGDIRIACYRTPRRAVPAEQRHRGSLSCGIPCGAAVADRRVAISAPWQLSEIELQ